MNRSLLYTAGAAVGAALGFATTYALAVEPFWLEQTNPVLLCPRLPVVLDGLRLLLLADTHIQAWGRREDDLLHLLETQFRSDIPDIVIWAGDMVQGRRGMDAVVRLIGAVRERVPCPTYAIWGNAEHKLKPADRACLGEQVQAAGATLLLNRHETLWLNGTPLTVAGVDDPYYGHADLQATLAHSDPNRFMLLLSHSPQLARQAARAGIDVMVSGHTHGGQVRLPLVGAVKTQNPLHRRMDCGYFHGDQLSALTGEPAHDLQVYISRGIGVAPVYRFELYPRFLCRPEVPVVTLRREDNSTG